MTDTFRALCAELADRLQVAITSRRADANYHEDRNAVDRARAALAKPEPVGPTDKELLRCMIHAAYSVPGGQSTGIIDWEAEALAAARAVLARWGTPNLAQVRSSLGDEPVPAPGEMQTLLDAFYILVAQTNRLLLKVEKDLVKIADGDDDWRAAEALRNLRPIMKRFQALATAEKERAPIPKPQPHGGRMIKGWQ